jgi:hypothetical protein
VLALSACSFGLHGRDMESHGGVGSNASVASNARVESNAGAQSTLVKSMADGHLDMLPWNEQGDRIPDFSYCGYRNGGVRLPEIPTIVTLEPSGAEDESGHIQAALDDLGESLGKIPDGRGALLLKRGVWKVNKPLTMSYSGVVLRGEGDGKDGTVLLWSMNKEWVYSMLSVGSKLPDPAYQPLQLSILDQPYVPVGATRFRIFRDYDERYARTPRINQPRINIKAGDDILIVKPPSPEWAKDLGMDIYKWGGKTITFSFERKVISCENGELVFDLPLPQSLDQKYGGAMILPAPANYRIRECGVESIRFDSIFDPAIRTNKVMGQAGTEEFPCDERHPGTAVVFNKIEDAWLRDCTALHMTHGLVGLGGRRITVQDGKSLDPISLIEGMRRYAYTIGGTANLIQRCYSRNGRHDFMTQGGAGVTGPNAFVDCSSESAWDCSENHQKWAMGTLYDNVRVNGKRAGLCSVNRGRWGNGHGWSGNTTVFWNCASTMIFANQPPLGQNFMIGNSDPGLFDPERAKAYISSTNAASGRNDELCEGALQGTAWKEYPAEMVTPRSLYYAQLEARLGKAAVENVTTEEQRTKR